MDNIAWTLQEAVAFEQEIKKSRFVGRAAPISDISETETILADWRISDATHNAWAWRFRGHARCADDGEVSGTAGRQILSVIEKSQGDCILVMVSRFYGGIRLGAGGLARAYGGTAAACLDLGIRRELIPMTSVRLHVPFACSSAVFQHLVQIGISEREESYVSDGLILTVKLTISQAEALAIALPGLTRGEGVLERC
ncbi:MAG: YigZ family protein [Candidatus Riflebacteria bacterium]|nr:YigZ family protein [Candidatus Riflebacteria bacterium]